MSPNAVGLHPRLCDPYFPNQLLIPTPPPSPNILIHLDRATGLTFLALRTVALSSAPTVARTTNTSASTQLPARISSSTPELTLLNRPQPLTPLPPCLCPTHFHPPLSPSLTSRNGLRPQTSPASPPRCAPVAMAAHVLAALSIAARTPGSRRSAQIPTCAQRASPALPTLALRRPRPHHRLPLSACEGRTRWTRWKSGSLRCLRLQALSHKTSRTCPRTCLTCPNSKCRWTLTPATTSVYLLIAPASASRANARVHLVAQRWMEVTLWRSTPILATCRWTSTPLLLPSRWQTPSRTSHQEPNSRRTLPRQALKATVEPPRRRLSSRMWPPILAVSLL
ncbi:hypothetical protein PENSPDRAFT_57268 [Peniophora sp. CONT]|nr:hypothetical protein PENSPDRAFT_57268 [Peniophora sp. CONT]